MAKFDFMLVFSLPDREANPEDYLNALFEAGCDDASVGVARLGLIGLDFTREASSAEDAVDSAIADVERAIPDATLVQVGPDLVGLTEMADLFGFTRQNMRRYATSTMPEREIFPLPVLSGETSVWHLAEVAAWLRRNTSIEFGDQLIAVSRAAARVNFDIETKRVHRILEAV